MDARTIACFASLTGLACIPEIIESAGDEVGVESGTGGTATDTDTNEGGEGEGDGDPGDGDPGDGDPGDGDPGDGDGDGDPPECTEHAECSGANCLDGECVQVTSCEQLDAFDVDDALPSGVYELDPDGDGPLAPFAAYCELEVMGGGWTLVLKSNGSLDTFIYGSAHWTSDQPFAPESPDLDRSEAKLASYTQISFNELLLAMEYPIGTDPEPLDLSYLLVPGLIGTSLYDLIAPGQHVPTQVGREAWKTLISGASLQPNCNLEGLNAMSSGNVADHHVRIGIIANEQNDCNSPNSRLGIGGFGDKCGAPNLPTGNFAGCAADNGDQVLASFGVVFVR